MLAIKILQASNSAASSSAFKSLIVTEHPLNNLKMHSISVFGAVLLALSSVVSAVPAASVTTKKTTSTHAGDICTSSPYSTYLPLSEYYLAENYCNLVYPLPCSGGGSVVMKTTTKTSSYVSTVTVEAAPVLVTHTGTGKITTIVRTTL